MNASLTSGRSDAFGQFSFSWNPDENDVTTLTVKATGKDGVTASETFILRDQAGLAHLLVRTDRAVYNIGETVSVDVITSKGQSSVYIDWGNNGQTVDMRTLDVVDGAASFKTTLDTGHLGANRIDAYIVGSDGNIVRTGRTIFVRGEGALSVTMSTDQAQYEPGKPAQITFSVTDETGAPAVAALGVQVVDEAVFALVDARPGLLRTYFELEDDFAKPSYEIRPPLVDLNSLVFSETAVADPAAAGAAQTRTAATFAALGDGAVTGMRRGSWADVSPQVKTQLQPYYQTAKKNLIDTVSRATVSAIDKLKADGCNPSVYYCSAKSGPLYSLVQSEVSGQLKDRLFDFWGNPYRMQTQGTYVLGLLTNGPDEKPDTADDDSISFAITDLTLPDTTMTDLGMSHASGTDNATAKGDGAGANQGVAPPAFDNGGNVFAGGGPVLAPVPGVASGGMAAIGISSGGSAGATGTSADAEPRVRQDFPETLYVNPQLITGADGKANISVDMADSITQWRVSSL
ncbi:MAG TPA: alpha-2-macroglobulin, partial [Polyangia bacterium]